jgi:hypothetical protein
VTILGSGINDRSSMSPPTIIDGRNTSCDRHTVARPVADTTLIKPAMAPRVNALSIVTREGLGQQTGVLAPSNCPALAATMADAIAAWTAAASNGSWSSP